MLMFRSASKRDNLKRKSDLYILIILSHKGRSSNILIIVRLKIIEQQVSYMDRYFE